MYIIYIYFRISITSFILALIINGTIGVKTGKTTSDKYHLSITPPSWAFSIWGIIFSILNKILII